MTTKFSNLSDLFWVLLLTEGELDQPPSLTYQAQVVHLKKKVRWLLTFWEYTAYYPIRLDSHAHEGEIKPRTSAKQVQRPMYKRIQDTSDTDIHVYALVQRRATDHRLSWWLDWGVFYTSQLENLLSSESWSNCSHCLVQITNLKLSSGAQILFTERIGSYAIILEPKIYCNWETACPEFNSILYLLRLVILTHCIPY